MQLRNLAAKLSTIDDHERRIADLEVMLLELTAGVACSADDQPRQLEVITERNSTEQLVADIERWLDVRISGWKYAIQGEDGSWHCTMTASKVADGIGRPNEWRAVKRLMATPGVWNRVSWYKAPPPTDWRKSATDARWVQWVLVRKETGNV